jgi:hypothetical protein
VQWKGGVNLGDFCHKVFFEGLDGAFRGIAAMAVRRHQLVIDIISGEKFFKAADASLSRVWSFGLKPLTVSSWWMVSYALTHYEADRDFMGMTLT